MKLVRAKIDPRRVAVIKAEVARVIEGSCACPGMNLHRSKFMPTDTLSAEAETSQQRFERILAQAKEESARIVARAQERAAEMVNEHDIAQAAQQRAASILQQAEQQKAQLCNDADDYAAHSLQNLGQHLERMLTEVRNGIEVLKPGVGQG